MSLFLTKNRHWAYLALAIVLEVSGTITMKVAHLASSPVSTEIALASMYVLIGVSYYFLALSVTRLPVGVAYAFWEGLGLTLITISSVLFLGETMTVTRFLALMAIVAGAALIHHGTSASPEKKAKKKISAVNMPRKLQAASEAMPSYGRSM